MQRRVRRVFPQEFNGTHAVDCACPSCDHHRNFGLRLDQSPKHQRGMKATVGRKHFFNRYGQVINPPSINPEICSLCGAPALYRVDNNGFCRSHRTESVKAAAQTAKAR